MVINRKYYWLFQVLGWGVFFLWHIFSAWSVGRMSLPDERLVIIQRSAGFAILGLVMTHLLRLIILRLKVLQLKVTTQIWMFIVLTLAISCVAGITEMVIYDRLNLLNEKEIIIVNRSVFLIFLNNSLAWFTYFITWSAIYFIYHYVEASQKGQIDNLKLKSHVKELELKTIKTHINPHFIFNSLNGIRAMVDENPQRARTAITELSNILRSSINIDKTETVSLADELNIIKDYLALEQMRFEDRLSVKYNIDDKTTGQPVPPMMMQMLVENAIKHGISHEVNGGTVRLSSALKDNFLELTVENTGRLKKQQKESGFGIRSILERLKLMYGDKAGFEITQSSPATVTARLRLPVTL